MNRSFFPKDSGLETERLLEAEACVIFQRI